MRQVTLTFPQLGLIGGTRAMLGAGIALLAARLHVATRAARRGLDAVCRGSDHDLAAGGASVQPGENARADRRANSNRRMPHRATT